MAAKKKFDPAAMRREFLELTWAILMKYLKRLDDEEMIEKTDARSGAGVVKTLFDAVEKAEAGATDQEEDIELPKIPETILDEFIERVLEQESIDKRAGKTGRRAPSVLPRQTALEC